jgi:hypothetical protein
VLCPSGPSGVVRGLCAWVAVMSVLCTQHINLVKTKSVSVVKLHKKTISSKQYKLITPKPDKTSINLGPEPDTPGSLPSP